MGASDQKGAAHIALIVRDDLSHLLRLLDDPLRAFLHNVDAVSFALIEQDTRDRAPDIGHEDNFQPPHVVVVLVAFRTRQREGTLSYAAVVRGQTYKVDLPKHNERLAPDCIQSVSLHVTGIMFGDRLNIKTFVKTRGNSIGGGRGIKGG